MTTVPFLGSSVPHRESEHRRKVRRRFRLLFTVLATSLFAVASLLPLGMPEADAATTLQTKLINLLNHWDARNVYESPEDNVLVDGSRAPFNINAAWCASFARYIYAQAGITLPETNIAGLLGTLTGSADRGGQYIRPAEGGRPVPGDLAIFDKNPGDTGTGGHVNIVAKVEGDVVSMIGGNQSDTVNIYKRTLGAPNAANYYARPKALKDALATTPPPPPPAYPPMPQAVQKPGGRDFVGDEKSDIFWYGAGGIVDSIWKGTATAGTFAGADVDQVVGNYSPIGGDFDGNGKDDVFWYAPGTATENLWLSNGTTFQKTVPKNQWGHQMKVDGYHTPIVGDFDGDGYDDIFWYARTKLVDAVWYGSASGAFHAKDVTNVVYTGFSPISGDFDGDGRTDIFWHAAGEGVETIWRGNSNRTFTGATTMQVIGGYSPFAGDFNGDGKDDIFWYAGGTAHDSVWLSNGDQTFRTVSSNVVNGLYIPISGDFNGDGKGDVFWYGPGSAPDSVWTSKGDGTFTAKTKTVSVSGYRPI